MSLELVRRSTLSSLPSAPEYSETHLAPRKKRERKKERDQKRKERETETFRIWIWISNTKRALSRIVGYYTVFPILAPVLIFRTNRLSTSFWVNKREHSAACGWFWTCPPHSFSPWFCNQPILVSALVVVDSKPFFTLTSLFCWDWQLLRVVARFVSESSLVTFRPYCRFPG